MSGTHELSPSINYLVKQASGNRRKSTRTSERIRILNQNHRQSNTRSSPVAQELDTFVTRYHDHRSTLSMSLGPRSNSAVSSPDLHQHQLHVPALPPIGSGSSTIKGGRLDEPLTIEEYESKYRQSASDLDLVERVFAGSLACNQLRAALWPYLLGLVPARGRFERCDKGDESYVFIEHEANIKRWMELQREFNIYQDQWKNILPDQETRFSTFRERKSLIERDVIRCDRLHPFYADRPENLENLTSILMTYMMYDFDIGYVQGMSDLAGPILYVYNGDTVKSFWVFVEVMKMFRRNFEPTQKTIHFQLNCLHELIKISDPIFAQYLEEHDSSNCFFAFRAIVCQFKRELMKEDEDEYKNVLFLWDTTWLAKRRADLLEQVKENKSDLAGAPMASCRSEVLKSQNTPRETTEIFNSDNKFYMPFDPNQSDTPRNKLTETEIFVLALCLSMIRRERDLIMSRKLDGTDIHLHFIDPKLASNLNGFIENAIHIYSYLKNDLDISRLSSPSSVAKLAAKPQEVSFESPVGSAEGYDLLNDFLIINGASGT